MSKYDPIHIYAFASMKSGLIQWCLDTSKENAEKYIQNRFGPFAREIEFVGDLPMTGVIDMADQILAKLEATPDNIISRLVVEEPQPADKFFLGLEMTADKYLPEKRDQTSFRRLIGKARKEYEKQRM